MSLANSPTKFMVYGACAVLIFGFLGIHFLRSAETYTAPPPGGPLNELGLVQQVAKDHPDWLANMYDKYDNPNGTWQFLDEVVKQLQAKNTRWAYNGKRGNPKDPSADVVTYYYGPGTAPAPNTINMFEVYAVDIMTYGQTVHWNDITSYSATPCVYGSYLYPRNSPMVVPELPETPPSCDSGEGEPGPGVPPDPVIPPIPGDTGTSGTCGDDAYQAGARAKDPVAIGAECRDKVWFQRNVNTALSCSSNFIFRGATATQWKNWSENAVDKVVKACAGDNVANADKILAALEVLWSSCLPGGPARKGVSCVCSADKDVEGTACEGFISDIGPPVINSISLTTAGSFQPITVTGKYLGKQIVLVPVSGLSIKIPVDPGTLANYLSFEVPDIDDGEYSVISSGSNGSSVESIKLTVLQGAPFPSQQVLPIPNKGLPTDLGQLISAIFVWSLSLIGLVIFVRFFYAGFLWFTAAGSSDRTSRAKTIMKNAVYGTLVLFSAWLILNTINPDLVKSTFTLPGLPASQGPVSVEGEAPPGAPPVSPTSCNQKFSVASSTGCSSVGSCVDVSNYTPTHGCESNGGICLLSSQASNRAKAFIASFNTLATGKSCTLKISSAIQTSGGPSVSPCHKPGNTKSGTCADFNITGNHDACAPYFYKAAQDTGAVVSFLDEYVTACKAPTTTGGNIHVNF